MKLKDVLEKIHKHYSEYDSEMAEANVITPEDYEVELLKAWALEMVGENDNEKLVAGLLHPDDEARELSKINHSITKNSLRDIIRARIEESTK